MVSSASPAAPTRAPGSPPSGSLTWPASESDTPVRPSAACDELQTTSAAKALLHATFVDSHTLHSDTDPGFRPVAPAHWALSSRDLLAPSNRIAQVRGFATRAAGLVRTIENDKDTHRPSHDEPPVVVGGGSALREAKASLEDMTKMIEAHLDAREQAEATLHGMVESLDPVAAERLQAELDELEAETEAVARQADNQLEEMEDRLDAMANGEWYSDESDECDEEEYDDFGTVGELGGGSADKSRAAAGWGERATEGAPASGGWGAPSELPSGSLAAPSSPESAASSFNLGSVSGSFTQGSIAPSTPRALSFVTPQLGAYRMSSRPRHTARGDRRMLRCIGRLLRARARREACRLPLCGGAEQRRRQRRLQRHQRRPAGDAAARPRRRRR